ncbi:MAG: mechanosensitive ion channel family protein [Pseudomonadales bacterium]
MFQRSKLALVWLSFFCLIATPALALTKDESDQFLKEIESTQKEITYYKNKSDNASDEDRILFVMQYLDREKRLRETLDLLVTDVTANEVPLPEKVTLTKKVLELLQIQSGVIKEEIVLIENFIAKAKKTRLKADTTINIMTGDQQIQKGIMLLDEHIEALYYNAMHLDALGGESKTDLVYLDQLLNTYTIQAAGQLELIITALDEVADLLSYAPEDAKVELTSREKILEHSKFNASESLSRRITLMDLRDLETASFQHILILATGQVSGEIFDTEVAFDLVSRISDAIEQWLMDNGIDLVWKLILFVLLIMLFRALAAISGRLVGSALLKSNLQLSGLLREFFISITSKIVMVVGILVALSQLGIQVTPLLAGLGMVGLVVGFALQDTLSNFASGLMILIYHPFDEGDLVEAAGVSGFVSKLSLVSTTILTLDNQSLVVPNSKIWGDVIRNVTSQRQRRVDLVFSIGYGDDIPLAEKVLTEILESHKSVLKTPEPMVKLHTLNESSVDFVVRPWVQTEDYWDVYWDVTRSVKQRFDEENISIPFPQRDVHIQQL